MFSYFDERFTLADDTLLMYTGKEKEIVIPASVHGRRIRKVGDNALLRLTDVTSVRFEEGIEELGTYLFFWGSSLQRITLPSTLKTIGAGNHQSRVDEVIITLKMSPEDMAVLRESSIRTDSGKYLIPPSCFPKEAARKAEALQISLTPLLSDTMPLFSEKAFIMKPGEDPNQLLIWQKTGNTKIQSEREGVLREILHRSDTRFSAAQEADADWYFKSLKSSQYLPEKQAIAYFTDLDLTPCGWDYLVNLHLVCAYFFRQNVQGVMLGTMYYVYSRYYAFPKGTLRVDLAVLNAQGEVVTDEKTINEVYGKYKLPFVF